ncbi:MAG TPA: Gfo/Idh/MocA family oxidoreductase [Planctomycetota bacterium]|nr:Gfo/Idh/MocA family oxidoreductase [Planctomycetota bacterium]
MNPPKPTRRSFLQTASTSLAAVAAGGSLGALRAAGPVHQGPGKLKIGIVGIGGRGGGATLQALRAHPENVLYAVGDAFADKLEDGLASVTEGLGTDRQQAQIDVPVERRFVGLDAIDQVLATGVDAVLLATPPGFRPMHIEKAVAKGVHIFAEKPVATDAPGVRRVQAACDLARQKNLSIVSGLCYRYHDGRRAIVQRLQEGGVGQILAMQGNYITGELWSFPRQEHWSELEWQLRNWLYYPWLSGDHIAEQHIHTLDVMAWIQRDVYPVAAASLGGRQVRTDPLFGTVYDHFSTIYEWEDGTRGFAHCRQQNDCWRDTNEYILGTEGKANVFQHTITGKNEWRFEGKNRDMYQNEHDAMFAAIRGGKVIHNGDYMCKSTMMALMGRMAAYTGQRITWEQAWNSQEALMPDVLQWDAPPPVSTVALPGKTKFV